MSKVNTKKTKVLFYGDSSSCITGFSTVSRNILTGLYNTGKYEIESLSINYWGDKHSLPWWQHIVGLNNQKDPYGREKVFSMIQQMDFDILFFLQDTFILNFLPDLHTALRNKGKDFRSICYYPIDGTPKEQWIKNIDACDYTVAYSEFGKLESMKALPGMKPPLVIPHGANTTDFYPISKDEIASFRKQFFASQSDKFIFTNVGRNQQRKDIPRTIAAFKEFKKIVPESLLYIHAAKKDQGWDLVEVVKSYGLSVSSDVIFPENFGPNQGYPIQILNMIYNASDCILSTNLGEGFGLAWIEAMATKTPIISPANTVHTEFITDKTGWLCKSGGNPGLYTVMPNDNEVIRPLVDVDDMVKVMLEVYNNAQEAKKRAENAYTWVKTKMDWQSCIVPQWVKLFDTAIADLKGGTKKTQVLTGNNVIKAEEF